MKRQNGFTLIEIAISLAIAALMLPALAKLYSFAINTSSQGDKYSQAYAYAQDGMESTYYQKSTNWDTLADSTSSKNGFTRTIQFLDVRRWADGELVDNSTDGAPDPSTKKVVVMVTWQESSEEESVILSSYIVKY